MNHVHLLKRKRPNALVKVIQRRLVPGPLRGQQGLCRLTEGPAYLAALGKRAFSLKKSMLIQQAEVSLGLRFSTSYRWFLKNFGGGFLDGRPIFTLSPLSLEEPTLWEDGVHSEARPGLGFEDDLMMQYLLDIVNGAPSEHITFYRDGQGRSFYFDSSQPRLGEYPIYVQDTGGRGRNRYASSFYEFLYKQVQDLS